MSSPSEASRETVIQTEKLNKIYEGARGQEVHALKNLDLTVYGGEIFAYLGPNGSGKTTTIKLLLGLIFPTSGALEILGQRNVLSNAVRQQIGYLPEGAYYPDFLRGEEIVRFYGQLYGMGGKELEKRIDAVLEQVGMTHARKRLLRGYSKGMRQRIGLAQALISDPRILILDEPTTGLDPIARKEIRDILASLRDAGKTLLISSHELQEVELISNRVGILSHGELRMQGGIDDLLIHRDVSILLDGASEGVEARLSQTGLKVEDRVGSRVTVRVPSDAEVYEAIERCKVEQLSLISITPRRETLEELFVRVIGAAEAELRKGTA